jgi:hypothetical protein
MEVFKNGSFLSSDATASFVCLLAYYRPFYSILSKICRAKECLFLGREQKLLHVLHGGHVVYIKCPVYKL